MNKLTTVARGAAFWTAAALGLPLMGALHLPLALLSRGGAQTAGRNYFRYCMFCLRLFCGVRTELRGPIPTGRVIVAAKHQSILDVFMIYASIPQGRFVIKQELTRLPVFGWFALRAGAVPVNRGGGAPEMRRMVAQMLDGAVADPQLCIYPQGTRVPPGARRAYKAGVHAIYEASGLPCVPTAVNAGVFLGKSVHTRPGLAVLEFLEPIPPGLPRDAFMARLEQAVETASDRLAEEARRAAA